MLTRTKQKGNVLTKESQLSKVTFTTDVLIGEVDVEREVVILEGRLVDMDIAIFFAERGLRKLRRIK